MSGLWYQFKVWLLDGDGIFWAIGTMLVVLLGGALWAGHVDAKRWAKFSAEHDCRVVGKMNGTVGVGTAVKPGGGVATVTTYEPGKTGYLCNDGVTYWR